jgi:hypothetical protein
VNLVNPDDLLFINDLAELWFFYAKYDPEGEESGLSRANINIVDFARYKSHPSFIARVASFEREVEADPNLWMRVRASSVLRRRFEMFEELLDDENTSPGTKLKVMEALLSMSKPVKDSADDSAYSGLPVVHIHIGSSAPPVERIVSSVYE